MTPEVLAKFIQNEGKVGARTLSYLGKHQGLVDALNSDLGKELLRHASECHERLARKVLEGTATPEEVAERKALYHILLDWSAIVVNYEKGLGFVKKYETQ